MELVAKRKIRIAFVKLRNSLSKAISPKRILCICLEPMYR